MCALSTALTSNTSAATLKATKAIGACCAFLKALDHHFRLFITPMTDLTPNDLSHLNDEEFIALCPQGYHAPGPEPLSPAAQAVLDGVEPVYGWRWMVPLASLQRNSISRGNTMTTTPDFRALAQELLDAYVWFIEEYETGPAEKDTLVLRARAALATPPPEPPTAIEIIDLSIEIDDAGLGIVEVVRAALERWGKQ